MRLGKRAVGASAGLILLLCALLAGCLSAVEPSIAPAAADRPQIWFVIVNRSDAAADLVFDGETAGRPSSSTIELGACQAGAWNVPIEERWTATLNDVALLSSGEEPPVRDSVARLEVLADGSPRLLAFGPGDRPSAPGSPDC